MILVTNGKFIWFLIRTKKIFAFLRSFNKQPNPHGTRIITELVLVILPLIERNGVALDSVGYSETIHSTTCITERNAIKRLPHLSNACCLSCGAK